MIYLFGIPQNQPQRLHFLRPGDVLRWVITAQNPEWAKYVAKYYQFGMKENKERGIPYQMYTIPPDEKQAQLLAVEYYHGAANIQKAPVQGGAPDTAPVGQKGQQRMDTPRDNSGFQQVGDASLGTSQDSMYGAPDPNQGWTDLVSNPFGGTTEMPR